MNDLIERQAAIDFVGSMNVCDEIGGDAYRKLTAYLENLPSAQPEPFVDADKLKRCRFEYINACKIVARPTPDTSKNDIYDAYAVIKALHPIFGDAGF